MKTLYEILEVSESASKEIIEKAYKVLAKKYHPDLQEQGNKANAEEMMKKINEAYDILGNEEKRKKYDEELTAKRQREENNKSNNNSYSQQQYYKQTREDNNYKQSYYQQANTANNQQQQYYQQRVNNQQDSSNTETNRNEQMAEEYRKRQEEIQQQYEARYQKAYENYLRSLGYRIKYKWTWKRVKDLLKTIGILIVIIIIIWFFPPTHKLLIEFYESNGIIKTFIDIIGKIIVGIWNAICSIFKR